MGKLFNAKKHKLAMEINRLRRANKEKVLQASVAFQHLQEADSGHRALEDKIVFLQNTVLELQLAESALNIKIGRLLDMIRERDMEILRLKAALFDQGEMDCDPHRKYHVYWSHLYRDAGGAK